MAFYLFLGVSRCCVSGGGA